MNQDMSPLFLSNPEDDPKFLRKETPPWNPTLQSFTCTIIPIFPFLFLIGYKMGHISILYLFILFTTGPLAMKVKDKRMLIRWICGIVSVVFMSGIKTAVLLTRMKDDGLLMKGFFYAFTALWECSNAVLVFGGESVLERCGIISYSRAFMACLCPSQVKFIDGPLSKEKYVERSAHIAGYIGAFFLFRLLFRQFADMIESIPILEAEAIVILISCAVHTFNLPTHLYQLFLLPYPIQIIYPYGSLYFSTSSREFWRKWSRPASALVRHMFYHPLGGSKYFYVSIPLMFFMNASAHYDVSNALVGDRSVFGWNLVFGVLGLVATLEVIGDKCVGDDKDVSAPAVQGYVDAESNVAGNENPDVQEGQKVDSTSGMKLYKLVKFALAMVALRFAAYTLLHRCLHLSLSSML